MASAWRVRREEHLRYLGHAGQELGSELEDRIAHLARRCEEDAAPRWIWATYGLSPLGCGRSFEVCGTRLVLSGDSMAQLLKGAPSVALLACTLGPACDAALRLLGRRDPLGQLVYDAACADLVEQAADAAEEEVRALASTQGLGAGMRFSPGYGDLSLDVQPVLLDVLQASKRLGIVSTDEHLLIPSKSVTALLPLFPLGADALKARLAVEGCDACSLRDHCQIRARGLCCHRPRTNS